jgi:hypothetical protein
VHLSPEFQHELGDDELGIAWERHSLGIAKELHACGLATDSKDSIGNVAVTIGIGEAQLLDGRDGKVA